MNEELEPTPLSPMARSTAGAASQGTGSWPEALDNLVRERQLLLGAILLIRNIQTRIPFDAAGAATECIRIAKEALHEIMEPTVEIGVCDCDGCRARKARKA
jgi:hypothetical protein